LRAVEYTAPCGGPGPSAGCGLAAPEGFDGDYDQWTIFGSPMDESGGLWTLHAWVWRNNPDGIFAPLNPRVD
jgi:hypothetical protein